MEDRFQVGVISSTHGIKGEVKVFPTTDDSKRFLKLKTVFMKTKQGELELEVQHVKFFKKMVIIKFKEFNDINEVECYKGNGLYVDRKNAVTLKKGEYFIADLIGLQVFDELDILLGTIEDVIQTGANDVYVVKMKDEKELLLPAIKECILNIDIENKKVDVHVMEGLLPQ